jgi:hypothetical protein
LEPIHVLVGELNGMLSAIITETLEAAPDIIVAAGADDDLDVAILGGEPEGLPPFAFELLGRNPWMNVLKLRGDGRHASMFQLRPVERPLGEVSPQSLLDAVRAARRTSLP